MLLSGSLRESREHWALIMRELARAGALAATCLVIVYLWWPAGFVRIQDYGYQETMRAIRTPDAVAGQLDQARTQLLASPQASAEIRQAVAAEVQDDRLSLDE